MIRRRACFTMADLWHDYSPEKSSLAVDACTAILHVHGLTFNGGDGR